MQSVLTSQTKYLKDTKRNMVFQLTIMKAKRLEQEMVSLQINSKDPILIQKEPLLTHTKEEMPKVMETKALTTSKTQLREDVDHLHRCRLDKEKISQSVPLQIIISLEIKMEMVFQQISMRVKKLQKELVNQQITIKDPILIQKEPLLTHTKEEMLKVMETKELTTSKTQLKEDVDHLRKCRLEKEKISQSVPLQTIISLEIKTTKP